MFIKLNYTTPKPIENVMNVFVDIINNTGITSVAALRTRETALPYNAGMLSNFDDQNSIIIRTVEPGWTAHYYQYSTDFAATFKLDVHDAPTRELYIQFDNYLTNDTWNTVIGTSVDKPTLPNTMTPVDTSTASTNRVNVNDSNKLITSTGYTSNAENVYTFWAHVTPDGMTLATSTQLSPSGWPSTGAAMMGPSVISQYKRYDYWNLDSNDMIPVYTTNNTNGLSNGSMFESTFTGTSGYTGHSVYNIRDMHLYNNTNVPNMLYNPGYIQPMVGTRSARYYPLNHGTHGPLTTQVNFRHPAPDLNGSGFAMFPLCWEASQYNVMGGNVSAITGEYIYNGDFTPGDTFDYNGKTYMIWPMDSDYNLIRIGYAVPME